jgi:leucyl aminopeptidase (aminopeptidase T)
MQPSMQIMEMAKNLKILFEMNARSGDSVLVLSDSAQDADVWMAVATAGRFHGCEITVALMADPRESHLVPPPRAIQAAMKEADLTVCATSKEFHTGGHFRYATEAGHKFLIMEGVTSEILMGPAVKADYRLMNEVGPRLKEIMDRGGRWHILSETGTDFYCEVEARTGKFMAGKADAANNPRHVPWASFPDGEFGASPVRGTGNGIVVWDTSVHYPPGLLREPIALTIRQGKVTKIEGGSEAQQLIEFIEEHSVGKNDEFDIELSIGFNPRCPLTGVLRTDKKHYGKIHTAIGDFRKGQLHIDGVTRKPTIEIGTELFMEKGVIKVPPLDGWV